jgi:hypothetical protein
MTVRRRCAVALLVSTALGCGMKTVPQTETRIDVPCIRPSYCFGPPSAAQRALDERMYRQCLKAAAEAGSYPPPTTHEEVPR